jgi:tetratricopeptide (TPR) repeat protein
MAMCAFYWHAERQVAGAWGMPLDDGWIHCTIARNLVQGHGWSYNPGVPIQNSSGPLWTLLVALGFKLFGTSVWVPKLLGAACLLGTVVWTARLALALGLEAWLAGACAGLVALSGTFTWHGLSAMETALAAWLILAALEAFYRWQSGRKRWIWVGLASLAPMARPEALVLLPLLLIERHARAPRSRAAVRELCVALAMSAIILAPYFALNLRQSGSLFPTTFAAKVSGSGLLRGLVSGDLLEALVAFTLYPYTWFVHMIAVLGRENVALLVLAPIGAWALWRGPRRAIVASLLVVTLPVLRGIAAPHQTPGIQHARYVAYLLPLYFLAGAVGAAAWIREAEAVRRAWGSRLARGVSLGLLGFAVVALVRLEMRIPHAGFGVLGVLPAIVPGQTGSPGLHVLLQTERLGLLLLIAMATLHLGVGLIPPRAARAAGLVLAAAAALLQAGSAWTRAGTYALNVKNIQDMDVELGRWVRQHVPPGTSICVNDIGAIAYFGERPIVDAVGLATPQVVRDLSPQHERMLISMRKLRPPVFVVFPTWFPEWAEMPSLLQPVMRHKIENNTILGATTAVAYRADWDRFDRYYSDTLLDRLDPPLPRRTLGDRWRRGLFTLGLRTRAELYALMADHLRTARDPGGALECYRRALQLDPQVGHTYVPMLQLLAARRDEQAYGATLQEMVRNQPSSSEAYEMLGDWQQASRHETEMLRAYETALELHPDQLRLLGKLASYWTALDDPARAATYRARFEELQAAAAPLPGGSPE